jgi:N-acyl amino acid synthase of PEP-CTERM/exosortase system
MSLHSVQQFSETNSALAGLVHSPVIEDGVIDATLLEQFDTHFRAAPANTMERIRTAQKIRHQVYCVEHTHEQSSDPEGLECDEFDAHASHTLLVHRTTNTALGTVRLVLPVTGELDRCFPVQHVLDEQSQAIFNRLPLASTAEVSRFSISRQLRRDAELASLETQQDSIDNASALMRLGLIQGLVRMSLQHGITHWCAAMEPTLLRMLAAMAIRFRAVGPLVEYHGTRQPCYCVVAEILEAVKRERPAFWSVLTDGGALTQQHSVPFSDKAFARELAC